MRKLKFSFAIVVAVLAVGFTIASNAKSIGSRVVTACFEQVQLTDGVSGTPLVLPIAGRNCAQTEADIIASGKFWLNAVPSTQRTGCAPSLATYCCLEFDEDLAAPAGVPNVIPQSGYASAKYKVLFDASNTPLVRCRN